MARADTSPGSPHLLIHAFPSGTVALSWRQSPDSPMKEVQAENHAWPIHLRLTRQGEAFIGEYSTDGSTWQPVGDPVVLDSMGKGARVGLAVLSHDNQSLTTAGFEGIHLEQAPGH